LFTLTILHFPNQTDTNLVSRIIVGSRCVALYVVVITQSPEFLASLLGNWRYRLQWHSFCTQIVAGGLKRYVTTQVLSWYDHPVLSYGLFYMYILGATVNLTFDLFLPKLGHVTYKAFCIHVLNFMFLDLKFLKHAVIKCRFLGSVARRPAVLWKPFCALAVGGG